jgi:hypothetical protein
MRVANKQKAWSNQSNSGGWWKSYKNDGTIHEPIWDTWDTNPQLKLMQANTYSADLESGHWRNQVLLQSCGHALQQHDPRLATFF